jgi:hypothetical protein
VVGWPVTRKISCWPISHPAHDSAGPQAHSAWAWLRARSYLLHKSPVCFGPRVPTTSIPKPLPLAQVPSARIRLAFQGSNLTALPAIPANCQVRPFCTSNGSPPRRHRDFRAVGALESLGKLPRRPRRTRFPASLSVPSRDSCYRRHERLWSAWRRRR